VSDSIILRPVLETDLSILFENQKNHEASQMAAFVSRDPADRKAFFAHWRRILSDQKVITKTILWRGQVSGMVGSFLLDGKPQVTYWIGKEFWGNGIATQALTAFLHIVRDRPLYASAAKDNVASIRVLEKCGFVMRGSAKAFARARGTEIDEIFFELAP
jgi:RimJ/RimL family protein N-acetyltransferase